MVSYIPVGMSDGANAGAGVGDGVTVGCAVARNSPVIVFEDTNPLLRSSS